MVAYHYPPIQTSSGVHRTLTFSRYIKKAGWSTVVLTVTRNAFIDWRQENEALIPSHVKVIRAFALDTLRHLSFRGKYPGFLATPDRWGNWLIAGVIRGLLAIHREKPDILFSTYPLASAHLIAYVLHKLTGIRWVADFRDPMVQEGYPANENVRRVYAWIEARVVRSASHLIFTTRGAIEAYQKTYPDVPADRYTLIENGYDEENFRRAEQRVSVTDSADSKPLTLLHSGLIYEVERDPSIMFSAIARLKRDAKISSASLKVILRASGSEDKFAAMIRQNDIADIVYLEPSLDYQSALVEMLEVDGLLLLQAVNCNHQIPAKAYEYLRCGKPVIALTDAAGDTAGLLTKSGIKALAPLDDEAAIYALIDNFVNSGAQDSYLPTDADFVTSMSREGRADVLARLLDSLVD